MNVFLFLGVKSQSPSVASFEELQGVIDFLSGASSGSLANAEKNEKIRLPLKTHKRTNSTTSLKNEGKVDKITAEGKVKLCHKKSASYSGKTIEMNEKVESKDSKIKSLKQMSKDLDKNTNSKDSDAPDDGSSQNEKSNVDSDDTDVPPSLVVPAGVVVPNTERTPGDGMDNKVNKTVFLSSVNLTNNNKTISPLKGKEQKKEEQGKEKNDDIQETTTEVESVEMKEEMEDPLESPTVVVSEQMNTVEPVDNETIGAQAEKISPTIEIELPAGPVERKSECNRQIEPMTMYLSTIDVSKVSQRNDLSNSDIAKSEPSNLHIIGKECSFYSSDNVSPNISKVESVSSVDSLSGQLTSNIELSSHLLPIEDDMSLAQEQKQQTLYEPFNSRLSWPVGLGNNLTSLWSDATLENEKVCG